MIEWKYKKNLLTFRTSQTPKNVFNWNDFHKKSYIGILSAFSGIEAALDFEVLHIDSGFIFRFWS